MHAFDWSARGALYWPERIAIVDHATGQRTTYAELDARAERVAAWLRDRGVGYGDRVGALAHNGVEVFDLLFACGKLGAALVPFNWRLTRHELSALIARVAPRVLFASSEPRGGDAPAIEGRNGLADTARDAARASIGDGAVVEIGASAEYAAILARPLGAKVHEERVSAEDPFALLFTGGTTGVPRAVKISHRMAAWNVLATVVHHVRHEDVTAVHTPMFHTGGLFVHALPLLALGGRVVVFRKWDADAMLRCIAKERVTVLFCVPIQFQEMLAIPGFRASDFSSMRMLISGGAPLPLPVQRAFTEAHAVPMTQGFGMTEFGPNAFTLAPEDANARAGSIGRPNAFVEATIVDADGRPVAPGETGELCLRGGALFSGYFGDDAPFTDASGWFHTGDLARCDDGYFHIVGRLKDMFVSGGENVYPLEIENVLYTHPGVAQCAVVGVPDERWGEVGRAFVVAKLGAALDGDALRAFLRERIAGYKVPRKVDVVDALPTSAAGKILKRELQRRAAAETREVAP